MSKKSGRQTQATAPYQKNGASNGNGHQNGTVVRQGPAVTKQNPNQQAQMQVQMQAQAQAKARTNDPSYLAAQEEKKRQRAERQATQRAAAVRQQRMNKLKQIGIAALAVLVIGGFIAWQVIQEANKPGEGVAIMADRNHIADVNSPHTPYSTDPPTSGPHVSTVPAWTAYATPIPKELQVHGLEDGGVVINYQPDLDQATVDKLKSIATLYEAKDDGSSHVLMSPYPNLSNKIVLTSWGRIDKLDTLDEARIRAFIDAYAGWDHHEGKEGSRISK